MPRFIAQVMLQDVKDEKAYDELDQAIVNEDGYPYITAQNEKIFALMPDTYEFEQDIEAEKLVNILKLICAQIEKKYNLKRTPIMVTEIANLEFANLEELHDEDFQPQQ